MNSMIIEQLKKANVIDSTGKVTLANLATYTLNHDILVVMYDGTVNNITGTYLRAVIEKWTFQDKAMGEQFITFDFLSEQPVAWAINDYCFFRGERFVLNYIPSVTQKGRRNAVLDSYKYEGVKLNSLADELTRCQMLDVVLTPGDPNQGTNYTGSSQFQLFCGETTVNGVTRTAVMILGDRILANLNRMYGENVWSIVYGDNTHTEDQQLSFDNQYVSEALAEVKNKFDLNYAVKGRTIYIGCELGDVAGVEYGFGPGYPTDEAGGKGLFELKKISDSSQQIVTRLRVLGSTKNLPYRYYNNAYPLPQALFPLNLQLPDTFLPEGSPSDPAGANTKWGHNRQRSSDLRAVKGATNDAYIDKGDDAAGTTEGIREGTIRFDGSDSKLEEIYPTIENVTYDELRGSNVPDQDGNTGSSAYPNYGANEKVNEILAIGKRVDGVMIDDANIGNGILSEDNVTKYGTRRDAYIPSSWEIIENLASGYFYGREKTLFTVSGVSAGKYFFTPVAGKEPYFHYQVLSSTRVGFIIRVKQTSGGVTTTIAEYLSDFTKGSGSVILPTIPDVFYMDGAKVKEISVSETSDITVTFTPCTKQVARITYTIDLKNNSQTSVSEYVWSNVSNMDSSNMPFHIFVKDMGFDFAAQFNGDTPTIAMKSGDCVGREFQILEPTPSKVEYQGKKGYILTLNRASDSSLNTYYPNSRNQIAADDQFVITGIDMPDAYVKAAEMRLLAAATEWLAENGNTHFHYQPAIDDFYLKRNYENMVKAGTPQDSVFWKIYAGYDLTFHPLPDNPSDPEPEAISVSIESVTITMGDGLTRKVDILLNDELKESTLKRVSREVKDLSEKVRNVGSGMGSSMIETIVRTIGSEQYLSKVANDEAAGDITFKGNISFNSNALFAQGAYFSQKEDGDFAADIDPEGNIHTEKNVEAGGGVAAGGMVDLTIQIGGGIGTVTGINFAGSPSTIYEPSDGLITLPDYPSLAGYATQNWVTLNFAGKGYENRVIAIESLIPSQASASNQLADKEFVNSSIATNTATFRGTYESVADLPDSTDIPDLKNNDYAFVIALVSSNPEYKRYKYTNGTWAYEYTLNNSSFTAAQWAAIISGITSDKVSDYDTHIARTDNPHGVTKAQVGLGNVENTKLSTWAGTANITTLGTIGTGIWHGTAIADTYIASAATWNAKQDALAFDGTYDASTNKVATKSTVTNAINALDVSNITGFGAGKTLASLTETDGKIAATFQDISITKSQVSDFPTTWALANITGADDLKAIEALTGTSGFLKKTAANTWALDTDVASGTALSGVSTRVGTLEGYFNNGKLKSANIDLATGDSNGQVKIAGTNVSVKGWNTAATHAHGDYVTAITYDSTNRKLQQSKGGGTATDIVTFGTNAFNSTAYLPLAGGTMTGDIVLTKGSASIKGNDGSYLLRYAGATSSIKQLWLGYSSGTPDVDVKIYGKTVTLYGGNDTTAKSVVVTSDGNIGVGLSSPAYKFHVDGDIVANGGMAAGGMADLSIATGGGQGTVTQVNIGTTPYAPVDGVVTLPDYPTWNTLSGKPTLATVATTGSYNDLTNKPTIPTKESWNYDDRYVRYDTNAQGLSATQKANARTNIGAGTYSKPSGGIPASDLAESYYLASNPNGYISGNQTITLSGDVSGSGATSIAVTIGAGKVTNSMLAGLIANNKLANSSISIAGTSVSLGGSISAATLKSNLGLGASAYVDYDTEVTQDSTKLITSGAVYNAIDNLPEPMIMKGTLGTNGTITSLPTASASNEGFTYKVITEGTYASQAAKVGDVFVSCKPVGASAYEWILIPAGDTDSDTWRNIKVNGTQLLGTAISSGAVNFKNGGNITLTGSGNDITLGVASGYAIPTTAKQDNWDTAYTHATDASRLTTAKSSGFYKFATTAEGHIASVTAVTASDLTTLIGNTTYAPYNASGYLPLSSGSSNKVYGDLWIVDQRSIVFKNARKRANKGGWAVRHLSCLGYDENSYFHIDTFGNNDSFSYAYLGVNDYNENNFRIYNDKVQWGDSIIWHAGNSNLSTVDWAVKKLTAAGQIVSNVAQGTAPLSVTSTTMVTNLNAEYLGGTKKADLFSAFANDNDQLSSTIGGTNKKVTVGYASRSTDTRTELLTGQEFIYRQTAGGGLTYKPSAAVLKRILGRTVMWNQLLQSNRIHGNSYTSDGVTWTVAPNGVVTANGTATARSQFTIYIDNTEQGFHGKPNHKYYSFFCKGGTESTYYGRLINNGGGLVNSLGYGYIGTCAGTNGGGVVLRIASGYTAQNVKFYPIIIDLTLFFNGNIPTGLTAETFERDYGYLLANPAYNAGTLINNACSRLESTGFNLWDEEWEKGYYDTSSGTKTSSDTQICSKNLIPVLPSTTYYRSGGSQAGYGYIIQYDKNKSKIGGVVQTREFTTLSNTAYISLTCTSDYGSTYNHDICINLSDTSFNGTYEPYKRNILDLHLEEFKVKDSQGNIITITGGLKQAGDVRDEIVGNKFIRRIGYRKVVANDLTYSGTATGTSVKYARTNESYITDAKTSTMGDDMVGILTINYRLANYDGYWIQNKTVGIRTGTLVIGDNDKSSLSEFQSLCPFEVCYELATPIEYEIIDDFPTSYPIDILGTERIVSDEMVAPFVADIQYGAEQRDIAVDINNLHISAGLLSNRASALESYFTDGIANNAARLSNTSAIGSTTKPVYFTANGVPSACSDYAGGTAVTLNGTSKAASTASFYAPTGAGTAGQILSSTAGAPEWINQSALVAGKAAQLETARNIWGQSFNGTSAISGDMTGVGDIAFSDSGKNIGGIAYFDTTNTRLGIGTSAPSEKLEVNGNIKTSGKVILTVGNSSIAGTDSRNILDYGGSVTTLTIGDSSQPRNMRMYSNILSMYSGGDLTHAAMRIANNGDVGIGIGSTTPDAKLHVGGHMMANGGVSAGGMVDLSVSIGSTSQFVTAVSVNGSTYEPSDGLLTLPAYPTWNTLSGKPAVVTSVNVGSTSYSPSNGVISLPAYPSLKMSVVTKSGSSWNADTGETPNILSQNITANLQISFPVASESGIGVIHYFAITNNSSSAKTVTFARSQYGAVGAPSMTPSVPAGGCLFGYYIYLGTANAEISYTINTISHP